MSMAPVARGRPLSPGSEHPLNTQALGWMEAPTAYAVFAACVSAGTSDRESSVANYTLQVAVSMATVIERSFVIEGTLSTPVFPPHP
jgi:hypothetical protein